jgi:hypothetical protein
MDFMMFLSTDGDAIGSRATSSGVLAEVTQAVRGKFILIFRTLIMAAK